MKDIYDLQMHEFTRIRFDDDDTAIAFVRRVPGGWLYFHISGKSLDVTSSTFVPWVPKKEEI